MRLVPAVLWSALVAWGVLEVGIRLFVPEQPPPIVPSENERLVYELDPAHPEINADGLRGKEIDRERLRTGFVIAAIGDSHTYSVRASGSDQSYPALLERDLRRRGYPQATVLNFGVPGYNLAQELEVLRARALAFAPDLVILQYTDNDTRVCNYIRPRHPRFNRLLHRSRLLVSAWKALLYRPGFVQSRSYQFVGRHLPDGLLFVEGLVGVVMDPDRVHPTGDPRLVPERYHYMLGRQNFEAHLREFGRLARERGVALLATGFIEPEDEDRYRAAGFDVVSFFTIFAGVDMERFGYRPDHPADHFDDRGAAFVARALADHVERRYLAAAIARRPRGGGT